MPTTVNTLLIVNPVAGHGRGKKVHQHLEVRLNAEFPGLITRLSERAGHAIELGRQAAEEGFDRVLCLGGDGTTFEVINGLYAKGRPARRPEIGLIPAGTGDSFVRDFGTTTPEDALGNILAGRRHASDLIEFEFQNDGQTVRMVSLNIIGVGLIADILKLTNDKFKPLGSFGYSLAVLLRLAKGMKNRIVLETDGTRREIRNSALVVSNSKYTGGKMMIAPKADVADGKADLVVFREVNRREMLAIFAKVFSGKHEAHPKVEMIQAAAMAVEGEPPLMLMADGELLGETPLRLKVLPGELTILV
jgi:YegS/Rv2252/BmrU family lipid kinase